MYTPEDSKDEQERDSTDTTNLRHPGVPPIIRPESLGPTVSAPVTGGDPRLRDVPAGRAQTIVTSGDYPHLLHLPPARGAEVGGEENMDGSTASSVYAQQLSDKGTQPREHRDGRGGARARRRRKRKHDNTGHNGSDESNRRIYEIGDSWSNEMSERVF